MIELHVIGTIAEVGPRDEDGNVVGPPVIHEGWHVDIYAEGLAERPDLEPYVVTPSSRHHVFSGRTADTVALKFADEATGRAVLGIE